jgi:hypothetical protein
MTRVERANSPKRAKAGTEEGPQHGQLHKALGRGKVDFKRARRDLDARSQRWRATSAALQDPVVKRRGHSGQRHSELPRPGVNSA